MIHFVALNFGSAVVCSIAFNAEIPLRVIFQYVLVSNLQPIDGSVYDIIGASIVTVGILLPLVVDLIKLKKGAEKDEEAPLLDQKENTRRVSRM